MIVIFRLIFALAMSVTVSSAIAQSAERQAILSGSVDSVGNPNFAQTGSGFTANLVATATPFTASFAAGFGSSGNVDFVAQELADVTGFWSGIVPSNTSYLSIDRNAGTGALTATQSIIPPQTGPVFDNTRYSLLHLDNNATDAYGNVWNNSNGTFSSTVKKFGTHSWQGNGTNASLRTTTITNIGIGSWTVEYEVYIPALSNGVPIFSASNAIGYGMFVQVVGSGPYHLNYLLSSTGNSWDLFNATGATNLTAGTFYHIAMTYDGTTYRIFLNGVQEMASANTLRVLSPFTAMGFATQFNIGGYGNINIDEVRISPAARYTANFTPPTASFTADGDWFDTNSMVMHSIVGDGPTFATVQRLYVAQATTNGSSTIGVINYHAHAAYRGATFLRHTNTYQVGNHVYYIGNPQILGQANITPPGSSPTAPGVLYVVGSDQVPPDALEFYIQLHFANAPINGSLYSDGSYIITLPYESASGSSFADLITIGSLGYGAGGGDGPFTEIGGLGFISVPVVNGVSAFKGINLGNTPMSVSISLLGYLLP